MSTRSFSFSNDNPLSTEAVLVNASSSRYEEDWPSIPHTHAFTELFYVSRGNGEFLIENQRFSIARDDLVIINPHILHTETSQSAAPLSYYTVGVDGISFSFRDQKEFQIFNCRKINTDLLFYFHSLFSGIR
ncbi:MAG: AraC family ligand binding domain-containing protein [Blautia faecis]